MSQIFSSPREGKGNGAWISYFRKSLAKWVRGVMGCLQYPSPRFVTLTRGSLTKLALPLKGGGIIGLLLIPTLAHANLNIVTTIKPVHSMVAAVTEGTDATLTLLVSGTASEHIYALKPSQAKAIAEADVVVYVDDHLERFLEQPFHNLSKTVNVLELSATPRLIRLPVRKGAAWVEDDDGDAHGEYDVHLWLHPGNAKLMVQAIANALAARDAGHAARYQANAAQYIETIDVTARAIKAQLAPFASQRFVVMHDAYRYFEKAFGLQAAGSVMVRPDEPLAVKHMAELRARMEQGGVACIFSEPQFDGKVLDNLTKNTSIRRGVLDPLGAEIPAGSGQYIALLKAIAASFTGCLPR